MKNRTTTKHVTFRSPFNLKGHDELFPAGDYSVTTEEVALEALDRLSYRRISTTLTSRGPDHSFGRHRFVEVEPAALAAALATDKESLDRASNEGMAT